MMNCMISFMVKCTRQLARHSVSPSLYERRNNHLEIHMLHAVRLSPWSVSTSHEQSLKQFAKPSLSLHEFNIHAVGDFFEFHIVKAINLSEVYLSSALKATGQKTEILANRIIPPLSSSLFSTLSLMRYPKQHRKVHVESDKSLKHCNLIGFMRATHD